MNGQNKALTVALAGNPNVGKSTLFNRLTGMNQHTGNWPGKTVEVAQGKVRKYHKQITLIDLPGTYGLSAASEDERVAAEYIRSEEADCVVAVCDGNSLARSLILVLEVLAASTRVVVCVNLMDEAERNGIRVDPKLLSAMLNAPVVLTSGGSGRGVEELLHAVEQVSAGPEQLRVACSRQPAEQAADIAQMCITLQTDPNGDWRRRVDKLLVSRRFGKGLLALMMLLMVWLTVWGAGYVSGWMEGIFDLAYSRLLVWTGSFPLWLQGCLIDGMFATAGRVICVMLPPMAIFFPLFTLLEDVGYLPRMAFLLDPAMARCGGCGRQALTMCMGLGCNAVGITGCRILGSPGQRLTAMLTNAFIPCNGRFPTLILLGSLLFPEAGAALIVAACVALGVTVAIAVSGILNKTVCRAEAMPFIMEMPPFRRPRLGQILVRSLLDRTLQIAGRAVTVAAPAGLVLWLLANSGGMRILCQFLDPLGNILGMDGRLLTAFLFCFPANELLIPVLLMLLTQGNHLQMDTTMGIGLIAQALTTKQCVCTMLFTLFHWPCATALMTFYKQTRSAAKTAVAVILPTAVGMLMCIIWNLIL